MLEIRGSFTIQQSNKICSTREYRLMFLDDSLLFIKTGGFLAAENGLAIICSTILFIILTQIGLLLFGVVGLLAFSAVAGALGGLTIAASKKRREKKIDKLSNSLNYNSAEEIMGTDNNNFAIPYNEIADILIQKTDIDNYGLKKGHLIIQTDAEYKFDIRDKQPFRAIEILVSSIQYPKIHAK